MLQQLLLVGVELPLLILLRSPLILTPLTALMLHLATFRLWWTACLARQIARFAHQDLSIHTQL
jgi:hypothetical protein